MKPIWPSLVAALLLTFFALRLALFCLGVFGCLVVVFGLSWVVGAALGMSLGVR